MNKPFKFPSIYFLLTVILGGLPFLFYFLERKSGSLPTSEIWYASGVNHGPWRASPEAYSIYYPLVILLVATLIVFISRGVKEKKPSLFAIGAFLLLAQIILLFLQMYFLTWTID